MPLKILTYIFVWRNVPLRRFLEKAKDQHIYSRKLIVLYSSFSSTRTSLGLLFQLHELLGVKNHIKGRKTVENHKHLFVVQILMQHVYVNDARSHTDLPNQDQSPGAVECFRCKRKEKCKGKQTSKDFCSMKQFYTKSNQSSPGHQRECTVDYVT